MKIDSIEIVRVAMPLVYPFRTAFGDDDTIENNLNMLRRVFQLRRSGIIPNRLLARTRFNAFEVQSNLILFLNCY